MTEITAQTPLGFITFQHKGRRVYIAGSKGAQKLWNYKSNDRTPHGVYGLKFSLENCNISDFIFYLQSLLLEEDSIFLVINWPDRLDPKVKKEFEYPAGTLP